MIDVTSLNKDQRERLLGFFLKLADCQCVFEHDVVCRKNVVFSILLAAGIYNKNLDVEKFSKSFMFAQPELGNTLVDYFFRQYGIPDSIADSIYGNNVPSAYKIVQAKFGASCHVYRPEQCPHAPQDRTRGIEVRLMKKVGSRPQPLSEAESCDLQADTHS